MLADLHNDLQRQNANSVYDTTPHLKHVHAPIQRGFVRLRLVGAGAPPWKGDSDLCGSWLECTMRFSVLAKAESRASAR